LQEELDSIFGSDSDREVTMADLSDMKYGEMCIKEALRLYPSVSGWFRRLVADVKLGRIEYNRLLIDGIVTKIIILIDDGRVLPRGAQVAILPYDIHRNPEVFPHPEEFAPDRFLPENKERLGSSGWIAFSSGPRNCIGSY
jgi:cytochrome P450